MFDSTPNFRDFGGQITADGNRVRSGQLYRSSRLARMDAHEMQRLLSLQLQVSCDLRGASERARNPTPWPAGAAPRELVLDLSADLRTGNTHLTDMIVADPTARGARAVMMETYRMLPGNSAPALRLIFGELLRGRVPMLIHCTAGKDRSGFVSASILHALGVTYRDILADYMASARHIDFAALAATMREQIRTALKIDLDNDALAAINGVAPEYLDAAYASAAEEHGSFDAYLAAVGMDEQARMSLRSLLLA
ncbi:MAG: tyrosine-protein phosphatase [Steroidobacteraceae bacterium]